MIVVLWRGSRVLEAGNAFRDDDALEQVQATPFLEDAYRVQHLGHRLRVRRQDGVREDPAAQLQIGPGPATVFVTGPGGVADKLDAALRQKLVTWLAANPALGLAAPALAKEVPRLPFVLIAGVDDASARALVGAMRGLGLEADWRLGGPLALREIRTKGWTLARRVALIGVTSVWYMFRNSVTGAVGGMVVIAIAALWAGFGRSARPVGRLQQPRTAGALPSALDG